MIFFKNEIISDYVYMFSAVENDNVLGKCCLDLSEKTAKIVSVSSDNDIITEGLIKAACNCAALKNFYMVNCSCKDAEHILLKLKFTEENGIFVSDIPSVLMGSCCK